MLEDTNGNKLLKDNQLVDHDRECSILSCPLPHSPWTPLGHAMALLWKRKEKERTERRGEGGRKEGGEEKKGVKKRKGGRKERGEEKKGGKKRRGEEKKGGGGMERKMSDKGFGLTNRHMHE